MHCTAAFLSILIVATIGCATRSPVVTIVDDRRTGTVGDLREHVATLVETCDSDRRLVVLESVSGTEFSVHCIEGQLQLGFPVCAGWNETFEQTVTDVAARFGFRSGMVIVERGCNFMSVHTNDTEPEVRERLLEVVKEVLQLKDALPVWFEWTRLGEAS